MNKLGLGSRQRPAQKRIALDRSAYFRIFASAANSAAASATCTVLFKCESASESDTVASHARHRPSDHGIIVIPSGRTLVRTGQASWFQDWWNALPHTEETSLLFPGEGININPWFVWYVDRLWHSRSFNTIRLPGDGFWNLWNCSFCLTDRDQLVAFGGISSATMPQGSVLGPLLFVYIEYTVYTADIKHKSYPMFIEPIRLLGPLWDSRGTYGLTQKLC